MDQNGQQGRGWGSGTSGRWQNAAFSRLRMVRIDRFRGVGGGLPRPVALFLTIFLTIVVGLLLVGLALGAALIGIGLALVATPFVLAWLAVRRATLGWRAREMGEEKGRENVVVRRPR